MTTETRTFDGEIITSRLDDWRVYEGVRTRRILAFIIDYALITLFIIPAAIIVFLLGILTLSLGWLLFPILIPLVALTYVYKTLGGPNQATIGMNMLGIRLDRLDGQPVNGLTAIAHTVLFWVGNSILTPLILLASLFLERKVTLHDLLLGTVVTRADRS